MVVPDLVAQCCVGISLLYCVVLHCVLLGHWLCTVLHLCRAVLCLDTVAQVLVILYCVASRHELFLLGKQLFLQGCPQNSHIIP